jgi:hypothetical protein
LSFTEQLPDDVRAQLAPRTPPSQKHASARNTARTAAEGFEGVRHSFASGSLAHGTANCPIHERDKGAGRRRRGGPGPPVPSHSDYPQVKFRITKRAILITSTSRCPARRTHRGTW